MHTYSLFVNFCIVFAINESINPIYGMNGLKLLLGQIYWTLHNFLAQLNSIWQIFRFYFIFIMRDTFISMHFCLVHSPALSYFTLSLPPTALKLVSQKTNRSKPYKMEHLPLLWSPIIKSHLPVYLLTSLLINTIIQLFFSCAATTCDFVVGNCSTMKKTKIFHWNE